jgi:paraquat-inducible protein B
MSRTANPTAIGAFVLGAAAIAVVAVVFFGGGDPFRQRSYFACFFRENVDGLQEGARVTFKGVPIGKVDRILVRFEGPEGADSGPQLSRAPTARPLIPVTFTIDADRLIDTLGTQLAQDLEFHRAQVEAGLRGQLKTSSLITGLLTLDLDYYPSAPKRLPGDPETFSFRGREHFVIPAIPSELTELKEQAYKTINRLAEIDVAKIGNDLAALIENLNVAIDDFDTEALNRAIRAMEKTADSLDAGNAVAAIESAAGRVGDAADSLSSTVDSWEVNEFVADARTSLATLTSTAEKLSAVVAEDSSTRQGLDAALENLAAAAAEIDTLAEYLQQHPNSIIFGRKEERGDAEAAGAPAPRAPRPGRPPGR